MAHQRRTIALLSTGQLHIGGVEEHLAMLVRHGDPARYRWLFIGAPDELFCGRMAALGAEVRAWVPAGQYDRRAIRTLGRLLKTEGVNLLHAHFPRAGFLGALAARRVAVPVVMTVHGPAYHYEGAARNPLKRRLYRALERYANTRLYDRVIYVSHRTFEEARALELAGPHATVIENGVELTRFRLDARDDLRRTFGVPSDGLVLTCAGRLSPEKGQDLLLEAAAELDLAGSRAQLWIVGDGPLRSRLEAQAAGLAEQVRFWGFRDDVPDLLTASDVGVVPSRYENMPLVVLECLAASLPCVATDVGDNRHVLRDGVDGRLVPPGDARALAAACRALLDDPTARAAMRRHARERADDFSATRMAQRVYALYDEVLAAR